ncbi:MAG: hypothetical protein P8K80_03255 [Phycisphaerales bacterium]|nr:hypothetical protein [Phycisphaerales bacterium]
MIDHAPQDDLLLGWIEDSLEPHEQRAVEEMIAADEALARQLHAMRDQRRLMVDLKDPDMPGDLFEQVERAVARPMLSAGSPGSFRRNNQSAPKSLPLRRVLPMAAMFLIGLGLLAALVMLNPLQWMSNSPQEQAANGADPEFIRSLFAREEAGLDESDGEILVGRVVERPVAPPVPLALVLPRADDEAMLKMLRTLALRTDATLLVNASPRDLLDPALEASVYGTSNQPDSAPLLMEVEGVLLGDASRVPTMQDQFTYAREGAVWTVTIPMHQFEEFLLVLDELSADSSALVLLEDHLATDGEAVGWSQAIRARQQWELWRNGDAESMIEIPIFSVSPARDAGSN